MIRKLVYSIFTNSNKIAQQKLNISLKGTKLTKEESPTYLGVNLDTHMKFTNHVKNLEGKAKQRLNLLKRFAGTPWGAGKITLRQLYLSYVRSILDQNQCLQAMSSKT